MVIKFRIFEFCVMVEITKIGFVSLYIKDVRIQYKINFDSHIYCDIHYFDLCSSYSSCAVVIV